MWLEVEPQNIVFTVTDMHPTTVVEPPNEGHTGALRREVVLVDVILL